MSCAALLDYTSEQPKAEMPEVVQLLWIHAEELEPSDGIVHSSQTHVLYQATVRYASGSALDNAR